MVTIRRLAVALLFLVAAAHRVSAAPGDCPQPCCPCERVALDGEDPCEVDDHVAREALAIGLAVFVPAYIAGTAYAWSLPGSIRMVDSIPIIGSIAAGARDRENVDHAALLFAGGVQLIGALVTVAAIAELASLHADRWTVTVAASPSSAGVTAKVRW